MGVKRYSENVKFQFPTSISIMKSTLLIVLSCFAILCGCALKDDVITLENRLMRLERRNAESEKKSEKIKSQIEDYRKIREERDQKLRNQSADVYVELDIIRDEVQAINGKLEEIDYILKKRIESLESSDKKIENSLGRLDETVNISKDRIIHLEKYLNFETSGPDLTKKADSKTESKGPAKKDLSENEEYALAKQAFDQGDFETAREGFKKLIKRYPKSGNADNAQFWIGESYYREKWYEKAILEYQNVIEKYPKGNKVQASLLKQGFSFFNLGDKANARLVLRELVKKYPKSNEAKIARKKLKGIK